MIKITKFKKKMLINFYIEKAADFNNSRGPRGAILFLKLISHFSESPPPPAPKKNPHNHNF